MTPQQYMAAIEHFASVGADEEIIALAREHGRVIHPQLTDDDLDRLYGMIESATMAIDLKAASEVPTSSAVGD